MASVSPQAAVTVERRVEWHDTDAAGHHHNSAILRWVEDAEAELLRRLGLDWLFGRTPRVRHEVDYLGRLWFGDPIQTRVHIANLGRTSIRFEFEVTGPTGPAARGVVVAVHALPGESSASPWPPQVSATIAVARAGNSSSDASSSGG
jgi:acyl-CoA thioester hydrolase